ncbi:unnamed protein product [Ambrosiozyma monospora]|uniref:Unnamed protein product n=1 Tax=Ambrosiozyma monospora TaxID=43982 RepID=A0ACB5STX7_AMBMO|nr:unnamed protein product [Ambrosiozyma monospora]
MDLKLNNDFEETTETNGTKKVMENSCRMVVEAGQRRGRRPKNYVLPLKANQTIYWISKRNLCTLKLQMQEVDERTKTSHL